MSSSSKDGLLAVCGSFIALSTLTVSLRFYVRHKENRPLKLDDWLTIPAVATYIAAAVCTFIAIHKEYLGVPNAEYTTELKEAIASSKLYSVLILSLDILVDVSLACSKLSIVFFYRRVFVTGVFHRTDWMNIATWLTIVVIILWMFVFQFLLGFECGTHLSALWDGSYDEYCTLSFPTLYGLAISDFLLDLWILVLPLPKIFKLHATPSKKLSVFAIFLLAFVGLGACIARMVLYIRIETGGPTYLFSHSEMRLTTAQFYYNMLEAGMSCCAINLPSLWILLVNLSPISALQSLRSLISLQSIRSQQSDHATSRGKPVHMEGQDDGYDMDVKSSTRESSHTGFASASQIEAQEPSSWTSSGTDAKSNLGGGRSIVVTQEYDVHRS